MKRLFPLFLGLVFLFISLCAEAAYRDVPINYPSIQTAINAAGVEDTVRVAQGIYIENILIDTPKDITIEGGWNIDFTQRSTNPSLTIIDGGAVNAVVTIFAGTGENISLTIRGFTIKNGFCEAGGGILMVTGGGTVTCSIDSNLIIDNEAATGGGIALVANGGVITSTITNNIVAANKAIIKGMGGGLYCVAESDSNLEVNLVNDTITDNSAQGEGGAILALATDIANTNLTIKNTILWGNQAGIGSELYMDKVSVPFLQ